LTNSSIYFKAGIFSEPLQTVKYKFAINVLNEHKRTRDIYIRTAVYILLPPVNVRTKWICCTVQPVLNGIRIEQSPVLSGKLFQAGNFNLSSNVYIKRNLPATEKISGPLASLIGRVYLLTPRSRFLL
jgi:hypothetical protein